MCLQTAGSNTASNANLDPSRSNASAEDAISPHLEMISSKTDSELLGDISAWTHSDSPSTVHNQRNEQSQRPSAPAEAWHAQVLGANGLYEEEERALASLAYTFNVIGKLRASSARGARPRPQSNRKS